MESVGCVPNAVTYNTLFFELFCSGAIDDAFELKREMEKKGLVAGGFNFGELINGLCNARRSKVAKLLLNEMPGLGLKFGVIAYSTLIDGFMREGNVDEAFKIRDGMVASGIHLDIFFL
ncbi:Pentatricopeptide repeat-containing protein [Dioscorea alata]|uniref:Pentatricopeptide repeat-containing protein n=1 Tax=Dioscorea alata TaxID=55571 RepID=A0ACB7UMP0_DIOAL|nr:Pentatricopeptide repeat-containing protein [Dioscorea alata]